MLNRTVAPEFKPINRLDIHQPDLIQYPNGLKSFVFQSKDLELLKFEFVFENHFDESELPMLNSALASMLKEGTSVRSSAEIAAEIDFYGAYLMPEHSFDYTSLTLYTMQKYVSRVLPIVLDILRNSIVPQKELDTYSRNNIQSLDISLRKNDFLARRIFYQNVFGDNRYGTVSNIADFENMSRERLLSLYGKQIIPSNCTLFIAGNVTNDVLDLVNTLFGSEWEQSEILTKSRSLSIVQKDNSFITENKNDSLQSAVRIGGVSINRKHADYPALQFVNTLFGGFFGSRLMRNIREDKGYTYSIGSAVVNLKYTGFFTLATEVGVDVTQNTVDEIQNEFRSICNDLVKEDELSLVRNYMQGVMLGSLESIFSHVDKFKAVYLSNMNLDYYDYYADEIKSIDAIRIRNIAQEYLDYDKMTKVVVGKL